MLAIYSLLVNRLEYTIQTIKDLEDKNSEDFVHFILDQGSTDGTRDWLSTYKFKHKTYVYEWKQNKGISHGSNFLIQEVARRMLQFKFDLICKVDNDVVTITPNWLDRCASVAREYNILCSPLVMGLKSFPNGVPGYATQELCGETIRLTNHIGGIVHMAKADLHFGFRYDPGLPMAAHQDVTLSLYARRQRYYLVGYLEDVKIGHPTEEQEEKYPEYFEIKKSWHKGEESSHYKPFRGEPDGSEQSY